MIYLKNHMGGMLSHRAKKSLENQAICHFPSADMSKSVWGGLLGLHPDPWQRGLMSRSLEVFRNPKRKSSIRRQMSLAEKSPLGEKEDKPFHLSSPEVAASIMSSSSKPSCKNDE